MYEFPILLHIPRCRYVFSYYYILLYTLDFSRVVGSFGAVLHIYMCTIYLCVCSDARASAQALLAIAAPDSNSIFVVGQAPTRV